MADKKIVAGNGDKVILGDNHLIVDETTGGVVFANTPAISGSGDIVNTVDAQTIGGAKTFSSNVTAAINSQFPQLAVRSTSVASTLNSFIWGNNTNSNAFAIVHREATTATHFVTTPSDLTNGTTVANEAALTILDSGNVGIGTASPNRPLEIARNTGSMSGTISNPATLRLRDTDIAGGGTASTTEPYASVEFYSDDTSNGGARVRALIGSIYDDEFASRTGLTFRVTGQTGAAFEAMKIANSGAVTLGPAAGGVDHDVNGRLFVTRQIFSGEAGSGTGGNIRFNNDSGTTQWLTGILGSIGATSYSIYNAESALSMATCTTAGAWTLGPSAGGATHILNGLVDVDRDNNSDSYIQVNNTTLGASASASLRLTTIAGTAFIAKNSTTNALGAVEALRVINETAGVYLAVGGTSWVAISDMRHKTKVADLGSVLNSLNSLDVFTYQLNEGLSQGKAPIELGLSAQQVLEVAPEIVTGSEETQYGISYDRLSVVLLKAIQELHAELQAAKAEIEILKGN